jgi:diaminohydroxyphosphoribosylaminopyrimidine deaminase / 5-amino-6-(5-phosphoribosylamino)uracil reductase
MKKNTTHNAMMGRCLELALNGLGHVSPNPLVGCVIVHKGDVIGEGFHCRFGEAHAEVNAIANVADKSTLSSSTLYVNLEPCSHHGKTPPCTELIIKSGIKKVVLACKDPNPLVAGKGIKKLKQAGIEVISGVLEEEAMELNRRFITFHTEKRPYIILKWAQTLDGFIDTERKAGTKLKAAWITSESLRPLIHKWRTEEDAIMVGTNTALKDDPSLTAREWSGKNPLRIVIDRELSLPKKLHLFDGSVPTLVLTAKKATDKKNLEYCCMDFKKSIPEQLMQELYNRSIASLIVEGGCILLESFLSEGLWDEARVFTGNKRFVKGVKAPFFPFYPHSEETVGSDHYAYYRNLFERYAR